MVSLESQHLSKLFMAEYTGGCVYAMLFSFLLCQDSFILRLILIFAFSFVSIPRDLLHVQPFPQSFFFSSIIPYSLSLYVLSSPIGPTFLEAEDHIYHSSRFHSSFFSSQLKYSQIFRKISDCISGGRHVRVMLLSRVQTLPWKLFFICFYFRELFPGYCLRCSLPLVWLQYYNV